ncbi:pyrroloquinoline quinone biosynthesis protein PqqF [Pseudomonas sp. 148P]|uniref:Coenzyme PQQ synthesis protein F n=1 Tax=Pseudomonas ulcerans TaxID=3115852 RepID=A0ABU7HPQ2_9PSED|nr:MULTISPECIES: pyrroloquinoline quinone biosynthesis protein PqqF [unclassified Pseudomonas]MEE1921926.1 pyrroloquinoline quinone biosynthesis protein PqqF [Pseudomonas sp. 147P]MEE1933510.1 pyrroloquinoline quinone biosynthesis protein PqqF [Pseudomonas sp. 148P]
MSSPLQYLTLSNGLRARLCHAPHLKRCAAAVRVQAGSHDAPATYPGLAHFLEHLFFLGTTRFPVEDGLMRFVQRQGGQLNATTRERHTEFFFEVPLSALPGALERLCDMLANPVLTLERQRAEREVIHAEWVAWSGNAEAQREYALLRSVSAQHPLAGFHAGNRESLPIDEPAFQEALADFHRRFYQAGQMLLSLSGPQPPEALAALAQKFGGLFATGSTVVQTAPPPLLDRPLDPEQIPGQLDLLVAFEDLPADANLDYYLAGIADSRPGGLVHELRARGWLEHFSATALYRFAGQALLQVKAKLSSTADREEVEKLIHDWLAFFGTADHRELLLEHERLQAIRSPGALELARRDEGVSTVPKHPGTSRHPWQLPAPEPLLTAVIPATASTPVPPGLVVSPVLPASRNFAALYLRWQAGHLGDVLKPLAERASRAGVELQWTRSASTWQLRCSGSPAPVLAVIGQALAILEHPAPASEPHEPRLIPIRQLMQQLPHLLAPANAPGWTALATGFDNQAQNALNQLLARLDDKPQQPVPPPRLPAGWYPSGDTGDEQALLLFSPVANEAAGRLLAQLIQGPFYQRLRSELQLGYAVFSAFRQIQGHNGLMFGVQSPSASHGEILDHLRDFLARPAPLLDASRDTLAAQFHEPLMPNAEVAEWLWQAHLAGNQLADPDVLAARIEQLQQHDIDRAWADLASETHWLILANGPAPG